MRSQDKGREAVDFKIKIKKSWKILSPIEHISKLVITFLILTDFYHGVMSTVQGFTAWNVEMPSESWFLHLLGKLVQDT